MGLFPQRWVKQCWDKVNDALLGLQNVCSSACSTAPPVTGSASYPLSAQKKEIMTLQL